jgi:hypothetical protein
LAWGKSEEVVDTISAEELHELRERAENAAPQKLVIIAGTSFGTAFKFLLLGAALGAAAITLLQNRASSLDGEDAIYQGLTAGGAADKSTLQARAQALLNRAKALSSRVREIAQTVAENARPVIDEVVHHAKAAADQTEKDFKDELNR